MSAPYLTRLVDSILDRRMRHHPAILLVGPRAAGKTTTAARLARTTIRLDRTPEAAVVRADPDAALRDREEPVLIDEWQVVPEVLGAIKRAVDGAPRPGRFLITGSVLGEVDEPTWPGTGRLLRISMHALTESEVRQRISAEPLLDRLSRGGATPLMADPADPPDLRGYAELVLRGGYPEPVLRLPVPERAAWLDSYLDQLLSRDLAQIAPRTDSQRLRSYLEAYALHTASVVDQSTLRRAAGVAKATGEAYEDLLTSLLIAERVPAWWSNRLKRLVRAPKRYFTDSGLALAALRIDLNGLLKDGHLLGRVLETFVMSQLRAELPRCESRPRLFHLRRQEGRQEIDILVEYGGGSVFGMEVKSTATPGPDDARHLLWLRGELGERFLGGAVLHTGPRAFKLQDGIVAAPIAALWG